MFDVAQDINMPASFVELRHEATHEELPSLQRLTSFTTLALDWLWQHYWSTLPSTPSPIPAKPTPPPATPTQLLPPLQDFLRLRRAEILASPTSPQPPASASGITCVTLVRLCRGRAPSLALLASLLAAPKLLIPANRTLGASMAGALAIWDNLLRRLALHQRAFTAALICRLIALLAAPSTLDLSIDALREAVFLWALHILCAGVEVRDLGLAGIGADDGGVKGRKGKKVGKVAAPSPSSSSSLWERHVTKAIRDQVVGDCVVDPNCWTVRLAKAMLAREVEGVEELRATWGPLVEAAEAVV